MIEAEMYGMIPSPKIVDWDRLPPEKLVERRLAHGRRPVKILGDGELKKALTVSAHKFSASAKSRIEAAGGSCEVLNR